ncbi:glycosyltransferase family 4 protein [Enterobacillus tribolii]|uniref:Glycosyltransferase involved in cell wall biosynthesis n=1 Tax=Enterobacillus tribolii TaxID=1487935 RepID=A0A370Q868_9GAMM|nr:glycosyltransferase family 4 protein [Enterobacillus tribolii]MBW7984567.1 glycosyltransferase family 1 protein [Enterobacillus tribolii]RDK84557.1 glycosyltransferase involved in cell wall biosynthesis [Enterobacillus tribolii]
MKVLFFVNAAWYFDLHWLDRAKSLVEEGHEVHVVTSVADEAIRESIENHGITCWSIEVPRFSKNPVLNIKILLAFRQKLKEIKPDLVHLITIKPILLGGLLLRFTHIPFVVSFVGLGRMFNNTHRAADTLLRRMITTFYSVILSKNKNAHAIFEHVDDYKTLSQYVDFLDDQVHIIDGAGIDIEKYKYQPECEAKVLNILFASRMLWSKGLGVLVDAVELVKQRGIAVNLKVAGIIDSNDPDKIDASVISSWNDEGKIQWLGTRKDVENLIRDSNLVILPTRYSEGVPRIILEACSMGRACIVSNVPGCKSVIQDEVNGLVLKKGTAAELADYIEKLAVNETLRRNYGLISSNIIKQRFAKDIVIEKTICVYESLLRSHTI